MVTLECSVLFREFKSRRGEILNLFAKIKSVEGVSTAESAYYSVQGRPEKQNVDQHIVFCFLFFLNKKMKNVSCEYDRWVVENQLCLCKLRDTPDALIGYATHSSMCFDVSARRVYQFTIPAPKMTYRTKLFKKLSPTQIPR